MVAIPFNSVLIIAAIAVLLPAVLALLEPDDCCAHPHGFRRTAGIITVWRVNVADRCGTRSASRFVR
jgi:hypothetical protein